VPAGKLVAAVHVPLWSATVKNVLAVALVAAVASVALSQAPPARRGEPQPVPPLVPILAPPGVDAVHPQKWEYKVRDLGTGGGRDAAKALEATFNDVAKQGYELERVVADRMGIFRRPFSRPLVDRGPFQPQPAAGQPPKDPKEDF
jgi:hypothetical protein